MKQAYFIAFFLWGACASGPVQIQPEALSLEAYYSARWEGNAQAAYDIILPNSWQASRNVQGERERQDILLAQGLRTRLAIEVAGWLLLEPDHGDLLYLEARLIQDSVWAKEEFLRLSKRFPKNLWVALGTISLLQRFEEWSSARLFLNQAERLLGGFPAHPAREFFQVLRIRQLQGEEISAEQYLWALNSKSFHLLWALHGWARKAGEASALAEVQAEIALLRVRTDSKAARTQALLRRLVQKVKRNPKGNFEETLHFLEEKSNWLNLPLGWPLAPQYSVLGLAHLVRPEASAFSPAGSLLETGHFLLLGTSPVTGLEALVLLDVDVLELSWGGQPIQIITTAHALDTGNRQPMGGAVFQGFYMRRDLSDATADSLERGSRLFPAKWEISTETAPHPSGTIPADGDLPKRIRRFLIGEGGADAAREHQWRALAVHEAAHLPDVLPLLLQEQSPWAFLPSSFLSWARWGSALAFLEYQAQLRALACGQETGWIWAETLEIARNPRADYFHPYRTLTLQILQAAEREAWPPQTLWSPQDRAKIPFLAQKILGAQGLKGLPADDLKALLSKIDLNVSVP